MADTKWSQFPSATLSNSDEVVGLHSGDNARFTVANIIAAVRQGLENIFVPLTRTINGKALNNDISLSASDVGAVDTADVGVADGVASLDSTGKVPSSQLPPISSDAEDITYDPTTSGLSATNVQDAIDEVQGKIDNLPSPPDPSNANPQDLGTAAAGSSADYSRADHVHNKPTYTKADIGLGNVDNVQQYSASNPPPYPVTSVNGNTGAVTVSVPSAYTSNPAMDGTASPGSSGAWARGDHVHPSDTTKANQTQLATVESSSTASRAYNAGEYFCWNGLLYLVTAAISSGGTFTPGTNCLRTTVGTEITGFRSWFPNGRSMFTVPPGIYRTSANNYPSEGLGVNPYGSLFISPYGYSFIMYINVDGAVAIWANNQQKWFRVTTTAIN